MSVVVVIMVVSYFCISLSSRIDASKMNQKDRMQPFETFFSERNKTRASLRYIHVYEVSRNI